MKPFFLRKKIKSEIDPEDVFPDSVNEPGFNRAGQEGKIESSIGARPFFLFSFFLFLGMAVLLFRLFWLEAARGDELLGESRKNELKISYIDSERGIFYDRNGEKLVSNVPSFSVVLRKKFVPDENTLKKITTLISGFESVSLEDFRGDNVSEEQGPGILQRLPDEIVLLHDAPRELALEIKARPDDFPGLAVEDKLSRHYFFGEPLSSLLGYTGFAALQDVRQKGYLPTAVIGKDGLESQYENYLKGKNGQKIVETDALGRILRERRFVRGEAGSDVFLNIDAGLQSFIYEVLKQHVPVDDKKSGAVVVSDVNDGSILALVSFPSFDNNIFYDPASQKKLRSLLEDSRSPFLNRAVGAAFPSGSSIKPFFAAAALEEKIIDPERRIFDPGFIEIPNPYRPGEKSVFKDWKVFGYVDMGEALAWSANVYFYIIGGGYQDIRGLGIDRLKKYANLFGLGRVLRIDLPGEISGLFPDPQWKKENRPKNPDWRVGDTYNVSIGQGDVLITPLQLNFATAALANGGKLMRPRIASEIRNGEGEVKRINPEILENNFIGTSSLKIVREGMRRAVTSGSASALNDLFVSVAGKTGTAQTETQVFDKNHAWFTGFAPYEKPEIAITVFVEQGGGGAKMSVPIAKEILEWYFARNPKL